MKPRVRLEELPSRVSRSGVVRECKSTAWGRLPVTGDATIWLGNRGERLYTNGHTILLSIMRPDLWPGYAPKLEGWLPAE